MEKSASISLWRYDAYSVRALLRELQQIIFSLPPSDAVVVDLGAESAPYRRLFTERGMRYVTCDLRGIDCDIVIEPGKPVPLENAYAQLVVSFQVLEHVWDLEWYLGEARRILSADGSLILSTHGNWPYHPHPHDFRRWTREGLIREVESRGFNVEFIHGVVGPLAWTTQLRTLALGSLLTKLPVVGRPLSAAMSAVAYGLMWIEDMLTPERWIQDNSAIYLLVAKPRESGGA